MLCTMALPRPGSSGGLAYEAPVVLQDQGELVGGKRAVGDVPAIAGA